VVEEVTLKEDKFSELILYFAKKSENDPFFGSTKLNKMLFATDFLAYAYLGHPLTGATYQHLDRGPAPRELLPIREQLILENRLDMKEVDFFGKPQKRPVALVEPDYSIFTKEEKKICDYVLERFLSVGAGDTSEWSHRFLGWLNTSYKEEIPYYTAFIWRKEPISKSDMVWAQEKLQKLA
jgi:hypothetical protein